MKIRFLPANPILFGVFASVALAQAALAQTPPSARAHTRNLTVDDYFRIKDVEDAQISPDGKWVAYVVTTHDVKEDKDKKRIWMTTVAGGDAIALTNEDANSSRPRWSPDAKYLGFLSERGSEKKQIWLLPKGGGEAEQLTKTVQDVNAFEWSPAGDRVVLVLQDPSPEDLEAAKKKEEGKADEEPKEKTRTRPWVIDRLHFKEDEIGYLDRRRTPFSASPPRIARSSRLLLAITTIPNRHGRPTENRLRSRAIEPPSPTAISIRISGWWLPTALIPRNRWYRCRGVRRRICG